MKKILIGSALALSMIIGTGCAPKGYARSTVGQTMQVEPGVVQSVKQVVIDGNGVGNTIGGVVGTVAGTAAGRQVGGGTGQVVATVLGAALGGVAGGTIGNEMDTNYGQEVVVRLNSGRTLATVLPINQTSPMLAPGQAVNVFMSGGTISNISPR